MNEVCDWLYMCLDGTPRALNATFIGAVFFVMWAILSFYMIVQKPDPGRLATPVSVAVLLSGLLSAVVVFLLWLASAITFEIRSRPSTLMPISGILFVFAVSFIASKIRKRGVR